MRKLKIGVLGLYRGSSMINYCLSAENAELVAICDKWEEGIRLQQERHKDADIVYYTSFDEFIQHDMDAVVLANYANEHAPFAIKAMEAGKDVICEVLPVQTMAEAVALIECCERTGRTYCYAENYCYMPGPTEIKKAIQDGRLGDFEYGEGEYLHNCEPCWSDITYGDPTHWRNNMSAFFYCTHSVGPLLHMTGLTPKRVTGFECPFNARMARMGAKAGHTAIEMITLENGAILKSVHGVGCSKNSIWYTAYGSKGRIESAREDAENGGVCRVYANLDEVEGVTEYHVDNYVPEYHHHELAKQQGHGGGDYYCMYNAIDKLLGNPHADTIDVYEALNMWMCGFFGYQSVLSGGMPMDIPDLRDPAVRDTYRNDHRCTDPKVAGEQLLPSYSQGNPDIPDEVYRKHKATWDNSLEAGNSYVDIVMSVGEGNTKPKKED